MPDMTNTKAVGWVAKVLAGVQDFFNSYQNRVKNGLIDTGDCLVYWTGKKQTAHAKKKVDHFRRQWIANRAKLK